MIRALLRLLRRGRGEHPGYGFGGYTGPAPEGQQAVPLRHGEYVYRASDGTAWHVQQHPDGDIRTQLDTEEEA